MQLEHKCLAVDAAGLKFDGDVPGTFEGYASVFNGVDSYGDRILPGAYADTLKARQRPVAMRWNHVGPVIGKWLELAEDGHGLRVKGQLTPGHSVAQDVYASLKHGAVNGLSIGYRVPPGGSARAGKVRELKRIELVEVSIVEAPADPGAKVGDVKGAIEALQSLADVETLLRDAAGISRTEATALVSRIKSLAVAGDRQPQTEAAAIADLIQRIRVPGV